MVTNDDDCDVINDDGQAKKPGPVLLLKVQRGWRTIFQASTALKTIVNHDIFGTKLLWTILYMAQNYCEPLYIWYPTIVNHIVLRKLWENYCAPWYFWYQTIVNHFICGAKLLCNIIYLVPIYCAPSCIFGIKLLWTII